jgi:hypothetical protein
MIPQLQISLDLGEGPFTVTTTLPVWMAWEKATGKTLTDLQNGIGATDLAILAYEGCKVAKIVVPATTVDFAKKVVDGPTLAGDDDGRPTDGAASTDH